MRDPSPPFGRWGTRAYEWLGLLAGLMLAVLTLAVFVQVVLRWMGWAVAGLDEVARYLFVWVVMIGAAAAMHRGEHTMLDFFVGKMSARGRAATTAVTNGAGMVLFLSMIWSSVVLVPNSNLQSSPGLGLSLGWVYAAMPVGGTLIILPMAWRLAAALRDLWQRPS